MLWMADRIAEMKASELDPIAIANFKSNMLGWMQRVRRYEREQAKRIESAKKNTPTLVCVHCGRELIAT